MNHKKINLAVLFGGKSCEHEVSLSSASEVIKALDKSKYNIIPIAITYEGKWLIGDKGQEYLRINTGKAIEIQEDLITKKSLTLRDNKVYGLTNYQEGDIKESNIDLVLPLIHGIFGEDGKLQGMLEMLGIPYAFSGTLASALAMNKELTKLVAKNTGLLIADSILIKKGEDWNNIATAIEFPFVVKPNESGSSVGISLVNNEMELQIAIENGFNYGEVLLIEKFIKGREMTVGVIGNNSPKTLPIIEIIPKSSIFYDYQSKYAQGGSEHICPADIPEVIKNKLEKDTQAIYQALDCRDVARADFIYDPEKGLVYFLEINTIPGMTSTSLVPDAASVAGINFTQLLDIIIVEALKRYKKF